MYHTDNRHLQPPDCPTPPQTDEIFTYIGEVLISVNPYKYLPCCSPDLIPSYRNKNRSERAMLIDTCTQSCVPTPELTSRLCCYSLSYFLTPLLDRLEMPPNIFALADDTYRTMLNEAQNQCVIISGESGAGKTGTPERTYSSLPRHATPHHPLGIHR